MDPVNNQNSDDDSLLDFENKPKYSNHEKLSQMITQSKNGHLLGNVQKAISRKFKTEIEVESKVLE
jgi:hypothetical protein